jgi:hypothetical protein
MGRIIIIFLVIGVVFGCTRLSVVRITDPEKSATEGIRFYRPYPYLLISEESKPAKQDKTDPPAKPMLQYKIIWLPDLSQEYAIQVRPGLGTIDFKPSFEEGWKLVGLDAKLDSKTIEMIEAASGLIEKGAKVITGMKTVPEPLQPGIYRFIYDMDHRLKDGKPNPNYGKITGVDFETPVATFKHQ